MTDAPAPHGWRTFLLLWGSQAVSVTGSALAGFAFTVYLTQTLYPLPEQKAQLAGALSLTALAFTLTAIFGAPVAGSWADRHDRRRIMLTCDLLSVGLSLTLALLILYTRPPLAVLIALEAAVGLVSTFHGSAFDTSYSSLVPSGKLPRANGLMQTIWSLSGLASPALAACIIALPVLARRGGGPPWLAGFESGVPLAMLLDAASFAFAALVLWRLRWPSPKQPDAETEPAGRLLADVRLAWTYIWRRPPLLHLLLTFALINFAVAPVGVFETLLVKFNLAPDWQARGYRFETALALITTLGSLGGVLGGVGISAWGGLRRRRVLGVLVPMIAVGLVLVVFGSSRTLYLSAGAIAVLGVFGPVMNAHSQAIWQAQVPGEVQGRVFAVRRTIAQFTSPLSVALAGVLAGVFEPGVIIVTLGLLVTALCAGQLLNPALRRVEDRAYLDGLAAGRG